MTAVPATAKSLRPQVVPIETLHKLECSACPLNNALLTHPKMLPTGAENPVVYCVGEAPGSEEDAAGEQFIGRSGRLLRANIPDSWLPKIRWSNSIRCRPAAQFSLGTGNREPDKVELECCRPRREHDIELTKPKAIFGFGSVPLGAFLGQSGITVWRGRRAVVRVGSHSCWYYPILHPTDVLRLMNKGLWGEEQYRTFKFDLHRAFAEVESLPPAETHEAAHALDEVEIVTGHGADDLAIVEEFLGVAAKEGAAGVDYETNGLRPYTEGAKILTAAVSIEGMTLAFPFDHSQSGWNEEQRFHLDLLWRTFLGAPTLRKIVHNSAFEMEWSGFFFGRNIIRAGLWEDTMAQAYVLDERKGKQKPGCLSLEFLVKQHFGVNVKDFSRKLDTKNLDNEPLEEVLRKGVDAKYHRLLFNAQGKELQRQELWHVYEMHLRRVSTCVLTQMKGLLVDQDVVKRLDAKYTAALTKAEAAMRALPEVAEFERLKEDTFNPNSNPQVVFMLKDIMKRPEGWTTDDDGEKKYSADAEILQKIKHPFTKALLAWRKPQKQRSTYVEPLLPGSPILFPGSVLHPQLSTVFTVTGRTSSSDPNEQNWPKRDKEAKEVRQQIVARPGKVFASLDLKQIEACVIAMASKDATYIKMIKEKFDTHTYWSERIAKAYPSRVGGSKFLTDKDAMDDFRTDIKSQWTFPLFFGATLGSVAYYLGIPENILSPHFDHFWSVFSGILDWQDTLVKFYRKYGYIECLTGRRRRAPMSKNEIINTPIQGTTADVVIEGMNAISEREDEEIQPVLMIHDDLTFELEESHIDSSLQTILGDMLGVDFDFINVPLTVELSVGKNWADMSKVGVFSSDEWFK